MKKILAFNGSPRLNGNTSLLLKQFLNGVSENTKYFEEINTTNLNIEYCTGCLRCNLVKKCTIRNDNWNEISEKIIESDILVFATPIYFHHVTASMKKIIDRFRSFINVKITENGIDHTPHFFWKKDFVLILPLGSSDSSDTKPVIELFEYLVKILGNENKLHIIIATRLGIARHIEKTTAELQILYSKINLNPDLAESDFVKNQMILKQCFDLGEKLSQ